MQLVHSNMLAIKCCLGLLLFRLLGHSVAAQLGIGSACTVRNGRGVCRSIENCASVKNDLLQGKPPTSVCGYQGTKPIVCCPTSGASPAPTTISRPIWGGTTQTSIARNPFINRRPARRMCAEYAKAVYSLEPAHAITGGDRQMVNVSLCAIKDKKLIVGGTQAEPMEFPHMAAVGYISGSEIVWNCGGALISDQYVLTAAHCTANSQWGDAEWVRVGDLNLKSNSDDAKPQDRRIAQRIRQPSYRRPTQYNDIALLKLQSPVTFNAYVRPACLSLKPQFRTGEKAVATGWGLVDWFDDEGSDMLLKVTLPVVTHAQCYKFFNTDANRLPNGISNASQFCAGQEGKDTCQGDSGGPLVVYSSDEECMYDIIGVTSFGKVCGSIAPGVYSRVYNYLSWIESIVWPNLG